MYVCMYVGMCVCVYVCVYIYIYIYNVRPPTADRPVLHRAKSSRAKKARPYVPPSRPDVLPTSNSGTLTLQLVSKTTI